MKVWVIEGYYYDAWEEHNTSHRVISIHSTKEKAEKAREKLYAKFPNQTDDEGSGYGFIITEQEVQ